MKYLTFLSILSFALLGLTSCNNDDSGSQEDPTYQLFPNGYFVQGFREEFVLTGSSASGANFEGSHLELTQGLVTFNGQETRSVRTQNDWVDTQTSASFTGSTLSYYSTDEENRKLLGIEDITLQMVTSFSNMENIPTTAKIGDSGQVGTYTDALGNTLTSTWELVKADNGNATIIWANETRAVTGAVIVLGNITYTITPAGDRQSMTILFDIKALADPVNWVGTKM